MKVQPSHNHPVALDESYPRYHVEIAIRIAITTTHHGIDRHEQNGTNGRG
jgi:hypothetical protein